MKHNEMSVLDVAPVGLEKERTPQQKARDTRNTLAAIKNYKAKKARKSSISVTVGIAAGRKVSALPVAASKKA